MKYLYFALAFAGLVSTWTYNILAWQELGTGFTPTAFVMVGFQGSPLLGSLASDFWVGGIAATIWMLVEAKRLHMRFWWAWLPLTIFIAWAFAFPLFLGVREILLEKRREGESTT